jgi:hypothetical protein
MHKSNAAGTFRYANKMQHSLVNLEDLLREGARVEQLGCVLLLCSEHNA